MDAQQTVEYLDRQNAYLVKGIVRTVARAGEYRGKVNLGKAVGARGGNDRAARPVASAVKLHLLKQSYRAGAYYYTLTDLGREVANIIQY
jgi:predicted transcriptional regulator with HTH domain